VKYLDTDIWLTFIANPLFEDTAMARKQRIDSIAAQVDAARRAASAELAPPAHVPLTDAELPFFRSTIDHLPHGDWKPHTLEMAALLARFMAALERNQTEARDAGFVVDGKVHPAATVANGLSGVVLAWRRSLGLHARALAGGDMRTAGKRPAGAIGWNNDDELLARPGDDDGLLN